MWSTIPSNGFLATIPSGASEAVDYDALLNEAYTSARPSRKKAKIAPVTIYNGLITKEEQAEAFNKFKMRYPKTAHNIEQRKIKRAEEEVRGKTALKKNPTSSQATSSNRTTFSSNLIFHVLILLLVPILAKQAEPIKINPFKENPGIYFEEIGQLNVINSHWNLISYYDITNYVAEIQGIRITLKSLENLCNQTIIRKNFCLQILYQFQHELQHVESNHQLLNQLNGNPVPRQKRSPLDIVGTVANKLFGVLDATYAEEMNKEIEKTRQNENHLLNLVKNQTSIIEATVNIIKKQNDSIQNQFQTVNDHITSLTRIIEKSGETMHEQQTAHLISSLTTQIMLILHSCQRVQDMLLDVLTDIRHNKVNPLILTPVQLRRQIALINEHLPRTLILAGNGQRQLLLLYSLMTIKGRVLSSKVVFQIRLPLLLNKQFQLFHLIPVPTPHNGTFIFIEPSTDYLAVGEHREHYFPMKTREVDKCYSIENGKYLCEMNHPIFSRESSTSQCEIDLLNHKKELSSYCKTKTVPPSKFWIQLHAANSWLYALDQEYTFSIICGFIVSSQTLNGSGIVKIRSDCLMKQPSLIIHGHQLYESHFNSSFLPKTNLSQRLIEAGKTKMNITLPVLYPESSQSDIQSLLKQLDSIKHNEALPQQLTTHDIHQFSLIYFILAIVLALGILYMVRTYCKNCQVQKRQKPIPAKRKKLSDEDFNVVITTS